MEDGINGEGVVDVEPGEEAGGPGWGGGGKSGEALEGAPDDEGGGRRR